MKIFYAAEESRFEFSFLPLMSACPETTTRGTDDVRAETRRKEMALLQKVTGISRSERRPGKKRLKYVKKATNYVCEKL